MSIKLHRAILLPRLSDGRPIIFACFCHDDVMMTSFCMLYFPKFYAVAALLEIVRAYDSHNNKTVNLRKHVTKSKPVRKWMVEFFKRSESRCDKIALVNTIRITKSIKFVYIRCWGCCDVDIFKLATSAQSIHREVDILHKYIY